MAQGVRTPLGEHGTIKVKKYGKVWKALVAVNTPEGTIRLSGTAAKKHIAEERLYSKLRTISGSYSDITGTTLVPDLCRYWFKEFRMQDTDKYKPRIIEEDKKSIERIIATKLKNVTIDDATRKALMLEELIRKYPHAKSKQLKRILVKSFDVAHRSGIIASNPASSLIVTETKYVQHEAVSIESCIKLLDLVGKRQSNNSTMPLLDYLTILLFIGNRVGELLALTWEDIDWKNNRIFLYATISEEGKVHRQEHTKARKRTWFTLPDMPMNILLKRYKTRKNEKVFPNRNGGWITVSNIGRSIRDLKNAAKQDGELPVELEDMTIKTLRKAVSSYVDDKGGLEAAKEQLTHSSSAVTRKHYIGIKDGKVDNANLFENLEEKLRQAENNNQ